MNSFHEYLQALKQAAQTPRVVNAISLLRRCLDYPERTIDSRLCANGPTFRQIAQQALAEAKASHG